MCSFCTDADIFSAALFNLPDSLTNCQLPHLVHWVSGGTRILPRMCLWSFDSRVSRAKSKLNSTNLLESMKAKIKGQMLAWLIIWIGMNLKKRKQRNAEGIFCRWSGWNYEKIITSLLPSLNSLPDSVQNTEDIKWACYVPGPPTLPSSSLKCPSHQKVISKRHSGCAKREKSTLWFLIK